ncbi:MAG: AAA family ATPase [Nitrososphaerota archaeon]|nr:AAA family ATPase [Nitrososphaerota archaeon]
MKSEYVPSGIHALDELLGGGYPRGRVILITGGPGSGKTLMAMQFLIDGVERFDERGVFVSLEESKYHLLNEMKNFGWDLDKYEKKNQLAIVDASPLRQISKEKEGELESQKQELRIRGPEFSIQALSTVIRSYVRVTRATRIVIDPITSLSLQFPESQQRRTAIIDLLDSLVSMGTTSLVTSEIGVQTGNTMTQREIPPEEYLCHGVIVLHNTHVPGRGVVSALEIEKMRETKHDRQLHPYAITEKGMTVYAERFLG